MGAKVIKDKRKIEELKKNLERKTKKNNPKNIVKK